MIASEFKDHPIWETVAQLRGDVLSLEPGTYTDPQKDILEQRLVACLDVVNRHKTNAARYYSDRMLNAVLQIVTQIKTSLDQLPASPSQVDQIDSRIDSIYGELGKWPSLVMLKGQAISAATSHIDEKMDSIAGRVESLEAMLVEKQRELDDLAAKHEEDLSLLENKNSELVEQLNAIEAELKSQDETISQQSIKHNESFAESQESKREQWTEWMQQRKAEADEDVNVLIGEIEDTKKSGANVLDDINALKSEVEKAASKATEAILARDYGKYSTRDFVAGIVLIISGIVALIIAGVSVVRAFGAINPTDEVSWQWTALKLSVAALISIGATICITFAKKFLDQSTAAKQTELELRAIHPFLADLDDKEMADKTKVEFIERTFGHRQLPNAARENSDPNALGLSKALVDELISLLKKNSG